MSQDIPQVAEISRLRFTYNFRRKLLTTPISDIMIFANSTYDAMMNGARCSSIQQNNNDYIIPGVPLAFMSHQNNSLNLSAVKRKINTLVI